MKQLAASNEHTAGILCLKEKTDQLEAWMLHASLPFFTRPLNDKWSVMFIEDDKLEDPFSVTTLIECSKFINLFYFTHHEDWGWGYRLFINGFEEASFYDDYHFDHNLAIQLAKERHPDIEDILYYLYFDKDGRSLLDALVEEINSSRIYLEKQFEKRNIAAFAVFGIGEEHRARLEQLICIEGLRDQRTHWRQVEEFKECLAINEMNRLNFRYIVNIFGVGIIKGKLHH
jgi:hypothetical protein